VVNLGMSGRLLHRTPDAVDPSPTHPGVRFLLDDGSLLVYHDPRRFGRLEAMSEKRFDAWSAELGPEPLAPAFTPNALAISLAGSSAPIRSWLLDQRKIAGVGNIYANEALYLAGIHPQTHAATIDRDGAKRLHVALREVLREAIRARGTTLRDYRTAQGSEGGYAVKLRVYGRGGEPCAKCGTTIERIVFGGRSAFVCRKCQGSV
jgi:formamidopyrimidine-DNA glycosylase